MRLLLSLLCFPYFAAFGQSFDAAAIAAHRENLDRDFATEGKSPLRDEDRLQFRHLEYFPPSEAFVVEATFMATPGEKTFAMKTGTERLPIYRKFGELHFTLEGQKLKLNVYQNQELVKRPGFEDYLFLPFSDTTNGNETYIGGRYLDMRIPKGPTVVVDFNLAYNPYCAYNYAYSCPIVPLENDLPVAIRAGVRKFHD